MSRASSSEVPSGSDGDMFSKLFTYDELLLVARPNPQGPKPDWGRYIWPENITVDRCTWVPWLPEGWGQGIKVTSKGHTMKCYVSPPPMKMCFHKDKVEEHCRQQGIPFAANARAHKRKTENTVKSVHAAPPNWPEGNWLPLDFRIAWRQLPSGIQRIYVPPGQDEGFLCCQADVNRYLTQGMTLSHFAKCKKRAAIRQEAQPKATELMHREPKKPKIAAASLKDYEENYRSSE